MISGAAFMFSGHVSMYATAKAALMAQTRAAAAELAPLGIRANALAPGTVDTARRRRGRRALGGRGMMHPC